jgi:hypothetical protein
VVARPKRIESQPPPGRCLPRLIHRVEGRIKRGPEVAPLEGDRVHGSKAAGGLGEARSERAAVEGRSGVIGRIKRPSLIQQFLVRLHVGGRERWHNERARDQREQARTGRRVALDPLDSQVNGRVEEEHVADLLSADVGCRGVGTAAEGPRAPTFLPGDQGCTPGVRSRREDSVFGGGSGRRAKCGARTEDRQERAQSDTGNAIHWALLLVLTARRRPSPRRSHEADLGLPWSRYPPASALSVDTRAGGVPRV